MGTRRITDTTFGYVFISPWLIGFFVFVLLPMLATLFLGLTDYDLFSTPRWIGLKNFSSMFIEDVRYWKSVKATIYFAFVAVPLKLVFALFVAMILNSRHRGVGFYRALYYMPSVVGTSVAIAVMWRKIFGQDGLVNAILSLVSIDVEISWLGNPFTAIWTLILLAVWQFGSPMLIFLAGLKQIPGELYESADIDGARRVRRFFSITLPMLTPIFLFNLIMQIIFGFTAFTQAFIITGGAPMDKTNFYALFLYQKAFQDFQMGYGAAMAIVLLLVVAAFTALVFKSSPYWVHYEAER